MYKGFAAPLTRDSLQTRYTIQANKHFFLAFIGVAALLFASCFDLREKEGEDMKRGRKEREKEKNKSNFSGCKDFLLLDNSNYSAARLMSVPVSSSCHLYC
jgi:hypothetical protein